MTVGRHPNTVRVQLRQLERAGLLERRTATRAIGRPRHEWAVVPGAGARRRRSNSRLGAWLARALGESGDLKAFERSGREIGREVAPDPAGRAAGEEIRHALDGLGFAPSPEARPGSTCFVLGHCPYRDAVRENQAVVCALHRGITRTARPPRAARPADRLSRKDPDTAGCEITVATV